MRGVLTSGLIACLVACSAAPASAFPVGQSPKIGNSDVVQVQAEFHRRFHSGTVRGGRYYRQGGGYGGAAIGAGLAGLAAGALIGGAIAGSQQPAYGYPEPAYEEPAPVYADQGEADQTEYCASRFQSYDQASGTYLGYDGLRHPCP